MKRPLLVCALGLSLLLLPSCNPKSLCLTGAKAACQVSALIPQVGSVASALCDRFAESKTVADLCTATGVKIKDFLAPFAAWLKTHGLEDIMDNVMKLTAPKPKVLVK